MIAHVLYAASVG